jgi:hypothetical protein
VPKRRFLLYSLKSQAGLQVDLFGGAGIIGGGQQEGAVWPPGLDLNEGSQDCR